MGKNNGHQFVKFADATFALADLVSGTLKGLIDLPLGAEVIGGAAIIDDAFDSGTSDTITVGDAGDDDRYKAGIDGQAAALTALVPTGYKVDAANRTVGVKWTSVGTAPSAGSGRFWVKYVVDGAADFSQR